MFYKYQYENEIDRAAIIDSNQDKYLIEEQNLFEGNFLLFSDVLLPEESQLDRIETTLDILLLKQEGIL